MIALFAAYVVALQALLLPLTVGAVASFDGSLCASTASTNGAPPVSHDSGCACAAGCGMACCAQALAGPPQVVSLALGPEHIANLISPHAAEPAPPTTYRSPQRARAPPLA